MEGAYDLAGYYAKNSHQDLATFVKLFPYRDYLSAVSFTDFQAIQRDRFFLWQKFRDGDPFLYRLGDHFVRTYPLQTGGRALTERITIGEAYLNPHKGFNRGVDEIYQTIGYFLLGTVARHIESEIAAKRFDVTDPRNSALVSRLQQNRIYINIEETSRQKVIQNIKQGRWSYLLSRLSIALYARRQVLIPFALLICVIAFCVGLLLARHRKRLLACLSFALLIPAISCLSFVAYAYRTNHTPLPQPTTLVNAIKPNWKLKLLEAHFPTDGGEHGMNIFTVTDAGHALIGQAIWLSRPQMKATYFAYRNVPRKFADFHNRHTMVLATTGGFTNAVAQPEGFTTEGGALVNAVLMHDRHGLALLDPNGGIQVMNLKKADQLLPGTTARMDNPLDDLLAYARLIAWCKDHKATLFQTQLLAFSDKVIIDEKRARPQVRERRLLALGRSQRTGKVQHIIFNLPAGQQLTTVAREIFALLQDRKMKVEAILNLDVGAYDILTVYDEKGNTLNSVRGRVDVHRATNLIVYYR